MAELLLESCDPFKTDPATFQELLSTFIIQSIIQYQHDETEDFVVDIFDLIHYDLALTFTVVHYPTV